MNTLFVDTHYLVAIINRLDQWHSPAIKIVTELAKPKLIVTDSVLIETLNYFAEFRSDIKLHAAISIEGFAVNAAVEVIKQGADTLTNGISLYKSRLDKGYSLTDCISMTVCRELGIKEVLTHDRHFEQEGFTILL